MKLRKLLISLMAMVMVVSSLQVTAFAETVKTPELARPLIKSEAQADGDALAVVRLENVECLELVNLQDLEVVVSSAAVPALNVTIPVERLDIGFLGEDTTELSLGLWLGYQQGVIERAVLDQLSVLQESIDLGEYMDNPDAALQAMEAILSSFVITINGLPEGHYKVEGGGIIVTKTIIDQVIAMVEDLLAEEYPDIDLGSYHSFTELINAILMEDGISLDDLKDLFADDPETLAALEELLGLIDQVFAYLTDDNFPGILIVGATLTCDCPVTDIFTISHRYYKEVNGKMKLVGVVDEGEPIYEDGDPWLTGYVGDTIKASDYVKCDYKGVSYDYVGSYDSFVIYDDFKWSDYKLDEFVLGDKDNWTTGLVLRYIVKEKTSATTPDDNEPDATDVEKSPETGDETPISLYIVLLVAAIAAIIALLAYKKRKNRENK